jgi:hypothetical protein
MRGPYLVASTVEPGSSVEPMAKTAVVNMCRSNYINEFEEEVEGWVVLFYLRGGLPVFKSIYKPTLRGPLADTRNKRHWLTQPHFYSPRLQ